MISEEEKFTTCWYDTTTTNINDNAERFPNLSFKLLIKERCSWSMWLKGTNLMLLFCFYIFLNSNTNADYPLADFKEKKLRPFCYSYFLILLSQHNIVLILWWSGQGGRDVCLVNFNTRVIIQLLFSSYQNTMTITCIVETW